MAHSFFSEEYDLVSAEPTEDTSKGYPSYIWPKGQWVIFHHNSSRPNDDVTICLRAIDGKDLDQDDPRRVRIKLPFGLLAEFVGFRICRDRVEAAENESSRRVLADMGLAHQGLSDGGAE